jgi:hypothetical protein
VSLGGKLETGLPDPLLLLPRLFSSDLLDRRLALLRMIGWMPDSERSLVVDVDALSGAHGPTLRAAAQEAGIALAVIDPPGTAGLGPLPAQADVADLCAVIRAASAAVAATPFTATIARAYGVPVLDPSASAPLAQLAAHPSPDTTDDIAALDSEFDAIAALARPTEGRKPSASTAPRAVTREATLQRSYAAAATRERVRRSALLAEIGHLRARLGEVERERDAEVARWQGEAGHWQGEAARWQGETQGLLNSKTWRYTEPARALYRRLRARNGR